MRTPIYAVFLATMLVFGGQGLVAGNDENAAKQEEGGSTPSFLNYVSLGASSGLSLYYGDLAYYYAFPKPADFHNFFRAGWSAYIERSIPELTAAPGLGARIHLYHGSLIGGRRPGEKSWFINFRTDYNLLNLSVKYNLTDLLLPDDEYRRWYVEGSVGGGVVQYRTYSWYTDLEGAWVYNSLGYQESPDRTPTGLLEKDKMIIKAGIPVALHAGYQITYKADITFDLMLDNLLVDDLDAHERSWSHKDKISYWGIGFRYTFGRSEEDLVKRPKDEDEAEAAPVTEPVNIGGIPSGESRTGLFSKSKKRSKDDELLELRLKLFETQLKLFEMQYLIFK
ncbi:MAG: hypothetical protein ACE5DN_07640 [Flavobacteriales bacterium]